MDTDSAYSASSGEHLRDVVKPELIQEYDKNVTNQLKIDSSDETPDRTPGLYKHGFIGANMVALTTKCYFFKSKEDT